MDYYRKLMGNGTVASKFRLHGVNLVQLNLSDIRCPPGKITGRFPTAQKEVSDSAVFSLEKQEEDPVLVNKRKQPIEFPETHHSSNCVRCYKLKKKCSRAYPKCSNCSRTGSSCNYIERTTKKRKRDNDDETEEAEAEDGFLPSVSEEEKIVAHKLVSISSMLSEEHSRDDLEADQFRNIEGSNGKPSLVPASAMPQPKKRRSRTVVDRVAVNTLNPNPVRTNLKEEFITMKAIPDEQLPLLFVLNFFQNYEYLYPFVNRKVFMDSFSKIEFTHETIINLDVYLLMAIGSIIHDSNAGAGLFEEYFNDKIVNSIVDILHFDVSDNDDDIENISLLVLLTIFGLNLSDEKLCWSLLGLLDRLMVQLEYYKKQSSHSVMKERIFWSIYNLDKELSLLLDRPSQLPPNEFIELQTPILGKLGDDESDTGLKLIDQHVHLHRLQDELLYLKLHKTAPGEKLKRLSSDLEKWRVATSLLIHKEYAHLPDLQHLTGVVNLNYYYLLIELDQVSASESFQFTLQFLSNSFSLLLMEGNDKKTSVQVSINSLFWYKKLFKVIKYNLRSLLGIIENKNTPAMSKVDVSLKLSEFNGNLQLVVNLLRYLSQSKFKPSVFSDQIDTAISLLNELSLKLMNFNVMTSQDCEKSRLFEEVRKIQHDLVSS